ncbi:MipA/OmpV family protein [Terrarubrum flagellatum]|uniref:MipA/OmpV family protein n=1 Tax=Terrirubrum flagellatum TaxID=2895980 RepID=UPI003144E40A
MGDGHRRAGRALAATVALAISSAAFAADLTPAPAPAPASTGWIVTLGAMGVVGPLYDGSNRYGITPAPSFSIRRPGTPPDLSSPDDSFDLTLFDNPWLKVGPVIALSIGRAVDMDRRLAGLDNYSWTVEPGLFVEWWPLPDQLRFRAEVRHGLRSEDGFVADVGADLFHRAGAFTFSTGPRVKLADSDSMNLQFGVTPAASARNGLVTPFSASGGFKSVGYTAAMNYDWSSQWRTTAYARYDRLVGDAASSPITKRFGSPNQLTVGLGASYSFMFNGL